MRLLPVALAALLLASVSAFRVRGAAPGEVARPASRDGNAAAAAAPLQAPSVPMPSPFTRPLAVTTPPTTGTDVFILQNLLSRVPGVGHVNVSSVYDVDTALLLKLFQAQQGLPVSGALDAASAYAVLAHLAEDGYTDSGLPPAALGYKYKVYVPVYRNRSVETTASLLAANGSVVYQFTARAHGADTLPPPAWPAFSSDPGMNQFTSDGNTPTGLIEFDLNTPEDDPNEFGPWPVNRAVQGVAGNAAFLIPTIRDGILLHTGAWSNFSTWTPPKPMPNSLGCIHAWPQAIYDIWQILTTQLGVVANPNTDGALPYPYKCQGLLSIQLIGDGEEADGGLKMGTQ